MTPPPPALALDPGLKWVWKASISSCLDGAANYLYILNANSKDTGRKFFSLVSGREQLVRG